MQRGTFPEQFMLHEEDRTSHFVPRIRQGSLFNECFYSRNHRRQYRRYKKKPNIIQIRTMQTTPATVLDVLGRSIKLIPKQMPRNTVDTITEKINHFLNLRSSSDSSRVSIGLFMEHSFPDHSYQCAHVGLMEYEIRLFKFSRTRIWPRSALFPSDHLSIRLLRRGGFEKMRLFFDKNSFHKLFI